MIPAIFDHSWVHPWRRPAEVARPVRLGRVPVRVVSPQPPYEPEPFPDEPLAPVYNYQASPLLAPGELDAASSPCWPNVLVFGGESAGALQGGTQHGDGMLRRCRRCDVTWCGDAKCWNCGRRA
jgi:hypothetical protein